MAETLTHSVSHPTEHLILPRIALERMSVEEIVEKEYPLDHYLSMELEDVVAELAEKTRIYLVEEGENLFNVIEELATMTRLAAGLMVIEFSYKKRAYLALADSVVIGAKIVDGRRILYGEDALNELENTQEPATIILYLTSLNQLLEVIAYPHEL
ncbi:MAG TPA: hypothetical protein EYH26_04440 [Pyrodictium sp.]|nr:hypothetical protein [Pyrodictium sp.]